MWDEEQGADFLAKHVLLNRRKRDFVSRVPGLQDMTDPIDTDVGINLCCCDRAMPQELLNISYIDVSVQQGGGECVTEHMRRDMDRNAGCAGISLNHVADGLFGQTITQPVGKEIIAVRLALLQIFIENIRNAGIRDAQDPLFRAFPPDVDRAIGELKIVQRQMTDFRDTHTSREK